MGGRNYFVEINHLRFATCNHRSRNAGYTVFWGSISAKKTRATIAYLCLSTKLSMMRQDFSKCVDGVFPSRRASREIILLLNIDDAATKALTNSVHHTRH